MFIENVLTYTLNPFQRYPNRTYFYSIDISLTSQGLYFGK